VEKEEGKKGEKPGMFSEKCAKIRRKKGEGEHRAGEEEGTHERGREKRAIKTKKRKGI